MVLVYDIVKGRAVVWMSVDIGVPDLCVVGKPISVAAGSSGTRLR